MGTANEEILEDLRGANRDLEFERVLVIEGGWDFVVFEVDLDWIFRVPRTPAAHDRMRREIELLPWLADNLPTAVPRFTRISHDPPFVGYSRLPGRNVDSAGLDAARARRCGQQLGGFLATLHRVPAEKALGLGALPDMTPEVIADFRLRVLPLVPDESRRSAAALLDGYPSGEVTQVLTHSDIGPDHILVDDRGNLLGVIDWADAQVGDPAIDLAWVLFRSRSELAAGFRETYHPSDRIVERARFYFSLAPWHDVTHGLDTGLQSHVDGGLRGILERLPPL